LKKELINDMVNLFGDIFNQSKVTSFSVLLFETMSDTYRLNLKKTKQVWASFSSSWEGLEGYSGGWKGEENEKRRNDKAIWKKVYDIINWICYFFVL